MIQYFHDFLYDKETFVFSTLMLAPFLVILVGFLISAIRHGDDL